MLYNSSMKLSTSLLSRLQSLTDDIISYETSRIENLKRLDELFPFCVLDQKFSNVKELFEFKAMNLMGITLSEEALGEIQKGRYVQLLVITAKKKEEKKATNISLGYFGKAELLDDTLRGQLTEFVLRFRYEKSFHNNNHYKNLIEKLSHE
jgi:hypothetical protein